MTNTLRYPLRNISPDTFQDLQEKYPNASVQIELSDEPAHGGLSEQDFWDLIALLDWPKEGNDEAVIEPVVAALSASSLLRIANEAYRRQKGTLMRYVAAYPIETFSNEKGWDESAA